MAFNEVEIKNLPQVYQANNDDVIIINNYNDDLTYKITWADLKSSWDMISNSVTFPLGDAIVPAISFGDYRAGIFAPDYANLAITTNGTPRFFVDGDGTTRLTNGNTFIGDQTRACQYSLYVYDTSYFFCNTYFQQDVTVIGNIEVQGEMEVTGDIILGDKDNPCNQVLEIWSETTIHCDLTVNGNFTLNGDFIMNGDLVIKGDLTVEGDTTLLGNVHIGTNCETELIIDSLTKFNCEVEFDGDVTFNGNITIGGGPQPGGEGSECTTDVNCLEGYYCIGGICTLLPCDPTNPNNGGCPPGTECYQGLCHILCDPDSFNPCPPGHDCIETGNGTSVCVPLTGYSCAETLQVNAHLDVNCTSDFSDEVVVSEGASINVLDGDVTANYFHGNGSYLTNLPIPDNLTFKGDIDATQSFAENGGLTSYNNGDFYLHMGPTGEVHPDFNGAAGETIQQNQFIYFTDAESIADPGAWFVGSIQDGQGFVTINGVQNVVGEKTFESRVTAENGLTVTGLTSIHGTTIVDNDLRVHENMIVGTDCSNGFVVKANATFECGFTIGSPNDPDGGCSNDPFQVYAPTILHCTLDVAGNTTLASNLEVLGNVDITGTTTFRDDLNLNYAGQDVFTVDNVGNVYAGKNVDVGGAMTVVDDISILGGKVLGLNRYGLSLQYKARSQPTEFGDPADTLITKGYVDTISTQLQYWVRADDITNPSSRLTPRQNDEVYLHYDMKVGNSHVAPNIRLSRGGDIHMKGVRIDELPVLTATSPSN